MAGYLLILGASSDIAKATAEQFAKAGHNLYLAGRNLEELKKNADSLKRKFNIDAKALFFDILDFKNNEAFYNSLSPKPSGVLCAVGYLGSGFNEAKKIIDTNFTGCVLILNIIANDFELRKEGFIIGICSVAGDRGRRSHFLYGSSKAGFATYLSGLRNKLNSAGVRVLTVKPGFVRTKMTTGLKLPKLLTSEPEEVAKDIFTAYKNKNDVIYTKWFWKYIMLIIKLIPEKIFKKLTF